MHIKFFNSKLSLHILGGGLLNFVICEMDIFTPIKENGCNVILDWENAIDFFECFRVWVLNVKIALKYNH